MAHYDACPKCHDSRGWHPDPSGPGGSTMWVCEQCGHMIDPSTGRPHVWTQEEKEAEDEEWARLEELGRTPWPVPGGWPWPAAAKKPK